MKKMIWSVITLGLILLANWGIAKLFNSSFLDWSFLTGLLATIIISFFNSSGGFASELTNSKLQSSNEDNELEVEVWTKLDKVERSFRATPSFYLALSYTIITGILTFIFYKDFIFTK
ncbi:hypothetical protein P9D39_00305 [Heyndrickxia oleronia]|uniref:DUF3899 domain-containing protein n=1 Tax=Heyndrickxia oleronia TaxID=38875 RepID=A0A8E2LCG7_9BACI|nr:hypothetical protein [Heyndrickxia oleronia]MEC1372770.1 hypothetical protein [Heyndrickxia oleronia]OJH16936.1 hypothetical protein BLX88_21320 [Bacillus obstructivus]OOP62982.1 hypothetical protein BWZ43_25535 [Heyndrickxia oleronia]QQZ03673.1 hypothetical protein I5818_18225 [Heyndrickxia oleronia]